METDIPDDVPEDLEAGAWFVFDHADALCDPEHGCRDYHKMWSMVRHVVVGEKSPRGGAFYANALQDCSLDGETVRVLIAGSADTGVPIMVLNAARSAGLEPEIHVVDRCRTPLAQIDRLAESHGLPITTERVALLDISNLRMDAVITHNVMRFIDEADRTDVVRALAHALRPDGRLLSIELLEFVGTPRYDRDVERRHAIFIEKLDQEHLTVDRKAALVEAAQAFWPRRLRGPLYDETSCLTDLEAAGLSVLSITHQPETRPTSPRMADANLGRLYSHVIAQKIT